MKEFLEALFTNIKRGILCPTFLACVCLCTVMMIFFVNDVYLSDYYTSPGLYYFLERADKSGSIYLIMMIAVFPGVTLFYEDWTSGMFKFIIPRLGRGRYSFAVSIAAGLTAAVVMILSYIIFTLFILVRFPAVPDLDVNALRADSYGFPNSGLLYTGYAFWCYLLYFLTRGAMAAFFAVVAVFQSMFITNKHLTAISPLLVYIVYFCFNISNVLPSVLDPFVLFRNGLKLYIVFGGAQDDILYSPIAGFYPIIYCAVIATILSLIETNILRKKMDKSI